jgi:hypothetical protein
MGNKQVTDQAGKRGTDAIVMGAGVIGAFPKKD